MLEALAVNGRHSVCKEVPSDSAKGMCSSFSRHSACREVPLRQDASSLGLLKEETSHAVTQSPLSNRSHIRTGLTAKLGLAILAIDRKLQEMPIGDLMVPSDKTYRSAWPPRLSKRRVLMRCPPRTPKRAPFQLG